MLLFPVELLMTALGATGMGSGVSLPAPWAAPQQWQELLGRAQRKKALMVPGNTAWAFSENLMTNGLDQLSQAGAELEARSSWFSDSPWIPEICLYRHREHTACPHRTDPGQEAPLAGNLAALQSLGLGLTVGGAQPAATTSGWEGRG